MADRVITAEAIISAKDNTGDVFARIGAKFQNIGKSAKSSKAVGELCDQLDAAARRMKALDKLAGNMAGFAKSRTTFNESKAALEAHARAMKAVEKPTAEMERKYAQLQGAVSRAAAAFDKQKTAMIDAKRTAEQFGAPLTKIAAEQARLKGVIDSTTHAIERQSAAEKKAASSAHENATARGHGKGFGSGVAHAAGHLSGVAGLVGGYGVVQAAEHGLETYREFDKERRYQKAVMGLSDDDQAPLIKQAIEGGASSRYNDIQWLEAQRELAARGLNRDQVLAITGVSANLGQAMDKSLPEASKALEGGMFGFGKDTSTYEKALANAKRTADLQVKASKISGMNYEDIVASYKYGAAPFRMAGLSEEQLLAFAGVGKKSNMGGDEMGVAARALAANLLKPTAGARTAMLANGIDYSKFQIQGGKPMDVDAFSKSIAAVYGVKLSDKAKVGLSGIFADKATVGDASKYMPAVMKVLERSLGKQDAKSKKSIAGEARRYRDASMSGVDAPALFNALIPAIASNPALANLIFGSKQGARIRAAIGDPATFLHKLDQLQNHADGYSGDIANQRMAGFDGAMYRLSGAMANLQTAFGRAFDAGGKGDGGLLTSGTKAIAGGMQAFVDAPAALQRLAFEAAAAATAFAGFKSLQGLSGGFGLGTSATALDQSAGLLDKAALSIIEANGGKSAADALGGLPGGAANEAEKDAKKLGTLGRLGRGAKNVLKTLPLAATAVVAASETTSALHDLGFTPTPNDGSRAPLRSMPRSAMPHPIYGPVRPAAPGPNWWQWIKEAIIPSAHGEEAPHARGPYGGVGLGGARASFGLPSIGSLGSLDGKITAVVDKPVDVTGKVTAEVKGQASVAVTVKVDGPGTVTNQTSSSSGNIKVSTGASMPGASKAAAGQAATK